MTTTTLVAGATGYLGRFVVAELHRRGHKVRAITRSREAGGGAASYNRENPRGDYGRGL